jgi:ureidoglycolate lyase
MKLLRYGPIGQEKPGMLSADGKIRDLSAVIHDISANTLANNAVENIRTVDPASLPVVTGETRIGACVEGVGKFVCIGLNYSDHAAEAGMVYARRTRYLHESNFFDHGSQR